MQIRKAKEEDITAVAALYDAVCDTLEVGENYPGWAKGDYPTRRDAEMGEAAGEQILRRVEKPDAPIFEKVLTSAYKPYNQPQSWAHSER